MDAIEKSDGDIIVLESYVPWERTVVDNSEAKLVVLPARDDTWYVYTVPEKVGSFKRRMLLPIDWSGLEAGALAELTGVKDALFCHRDLFIAGAGSKEGAIAMAKLALVPA
jgi:uncharacterized UPF0160 family protein